MREGRERKGGGSEYSSLMSRLGIAIEFHLVSA